MYAIVEIAGHQFKVEQDQQLLVNRLQGEEGDVLSFDRVLLTDNGSITVGAPVIEGVAVEAKILEHLRGDKVIVFKKKRRKGYRKKNGHRQALTKIEIVGIGASKGGSKAKASKAEAKPTAKASKEVKAEETSAKAAKPAAQKEETAKPKAETASKAAAKKEAPAKKATKAKGDDLTKVEGVGPKAAEALNNAGIMTYADLAAKKADDVKEILTNAPGRLAHLDPGTWAEQAQLAADGKWDELKELQDKLIGGK